MSRIDRRAYADMYGPTVGDRIRLGDTELWIEVERDFAIHGEEVKFGGGKVIRDGMGQSQAGCADTPDTVTGAACADEVEPFPVWPWSLRPQHRTTPESNEQACGPSTVGKNCGVLGPDPPIEPSPSWPQVLSPSHCVRNPLRPSP